MYVVEEPVEGVGGLVVVGAVGGALAGLNQHHILVEALAVLTAELDAHCAGLLGAAAAAIHARATVLGTVLLQAGAAGECELDWLGRLLGSVALLSFLKTGIRRLSAWTDLADTALLDQLALCIVVGDPGGDACATGLGTLRPGCGLNNALLAAEHVGLDLDSECRKRFQASLHISHQLISVGEVILRLVGHGLLAEQFLGGLQVCRVVTDPFLAALARDLDQPRVCTAQGGQGQFLGAERYAAHCSVNACALVFAVGLKAFSILVDPAVVLAGSAFRFGSADASGCTETSAEVALESFGVVTWLHLAAVFVELPRAHLAAAAGIRHQADSWCALGQLQGTLTLLRACAKYHAEAPEEYQDHRQKSCHVASCLLQETKTKRDNSSGFKLLFRRC